MDEVVTTRIPSEKEQLAFLKNVQAFFAEGQFTATYKFALLIALAELSVESGIMDDATLEISIERIADKFVSYYWRQSELWSPVGRDLRAGVLIQNMGAQAKVITRLLEIREEVSTYETDVRRNPKAWRSLLKAVKRVVREQPLWKLQTLSGHPVEFLYKNTKNGDSIVLQAGAAFNLGRFHALVTSLARSAWAQFIRGLKRNQRMLGQAVDLEPFLFGTPRAELREYRKILKTVHGDRCFYCESNLRDGGVVDHFIPWRRYQVDLAHNFVLADTRCNSRKSDFLADVPFLAKWLRQNDDTQDLLAKAFAGHHLPFDYNVSKQVTRWAYGQVEQTGGQVWAPQKIYKALGSDWRHVFGAV